MMVINSSPFGGKTRTAVLLALRLLVESHPRELARILETGLSGVQQAIRRLEAEGLVAGRAVGRTKLYRINPRYFAYGDLQKYLLRLTEPEERLRTRVESLRRRPRRTGKRL
jgi:DNA-binding transcriptional ArsR family regulator